MLASEKLSSPDEGPVRKIIAKFYWLCYAQQLLREKMRSNVSVADQPDDVSNRRQ